MHIIEIPQPEDSEYTKFEYDASVTQQGGIVDLLGDREFCGGINETTLVVDIYNEAGLKEIYINHPPSHNPDHTDDLLRKGLIIEPDPLKVPRGNVYMASAHGAPKGLREVVTNHGNDFVDLTCVFVKTVQLGVEKDDDNGRLTLYSGQRGHQEQIAVSSYREDQNNFVTIYSATEAKEMIDWILGQRNGREVTFRQQTTHSAITHDEVETVLRGEIPDLKAPPRRDTCRAVRHRQDSVLLQVPRGTDIVVSVGGPNSHNTKELAAIAVQKSEGRIAGHVVRNEEDMRDEWFDGESYVTLTAGASTPPEPVTRVKNALLAKGYVVRHLKKRFPEPADETFAPPRSVEETLVKRGLPVPERLRELRSKAA